MPRTRVHAEAGCPRGPRAPRLWSCRRSPNPHSGRRRRPAEDRGRASRSRSLRTGRCSPVPGGAWGGRGVGGRPGSPSFQVPELETNGTRFGVFISFLVKRKVLRFCTENRGDKQDGPSLRAEEAGRSPRDPQGQAGVQGHSPARYCDSSDGSAVASKLQVQSTDGKEA